MAKAIKITTSSDNTYSVKPVGDGNWAATLVGDAEPRFTFAAPEDSSKETLAGEIDYLEMTAEDADGIEDDEYYYDYA